MASRYEHQRYCYDYEPCQYGLSKEDCKAIRNGDAETVRESEDDASLSVITASVAAEIIDDLATPSETASSDFSGGGGDFGGGGSSGDF